MQYFILPVIMFIFFELLGQVVTRKHQIHSFVLNSIIGFSVFLGIYYIICTPLVLIHAKFSVVSIVSLLYFLCSILYIFKNRKEIKWSVKPKHIIIFILLIAVQLFFTLRNSIGSVSLYDTINYTNLVTGNIYLDGLNTFEMHNGYAGTLTGYAFQSYYTLASVLYYLVNGVCAKLHIDFFYFTQHTWFYSVLLYAFLAEMIINFIEEFKYKNVFSYVFIVSFFVLFMGNFYWNSEQAYLGNSFRMMLVSYSLFYLGMFIKEERRENLIMFSLISYADCACANSNTTLTVLLVFGAWIFLKEKKNTLRILITTIALPMFHLLYQVTGNFTYGTVMLLVLVVLFIFEEWVAKFIQLLRLKQVLPLVVFVFLIITSFLITRNIFDLSAFLNNWSGWSDMTWDYTDMSTLWRISANLVYIVLMVLVLYRNRKNALVKILLIVALIFFNPFAAPIQNKYMPVFYRNYDIVINYLMLFWAIKEVEGLFGNKMVENVVLVFLCVCSLYSAYHQIGYHPNDSFKKEKGYDEILRMTKDEADTIRFTKEFVLSNGIKDAKMISSILQMHTEMPWLKTLYGRNKAFNHKENEWELYKVFYPAEYYGDPYAPENPQYDKMCEYIFDNSYSLIVQDKRISYYDEAKDIYYSITYLIDSCGSYPVYENDTFAVYYYDYE